MSSRSKAWLVAATIGAVEASKDQLGLCRWNYMIRSVNQRIRNNVRSAAQVNRFSSSSTIPRASCKEGEKAKQAEESLRTVMYLSCWGPNWWRQIDRDFYFCFAVDWIRQVVSMWRSCEIQILNRRYEFWGFWWVLSGCNQITDSNCIRQNDTCTEFRDEYKSLCKSCMLLENIELSTRLTHHTFPLLLISSLTICSS